MKTRELHLGDLALFTDQPTSSQPDPARGALVRVVELNVEHSFWARTGRSDGGGRRVVSTGVLVEAVDEVERPAGSQFTCRAGQLHSWAIHADDYRRFRREQAEQADRQAKQEQSVDRLHRLLGVKPEPIDNWLRPADPARVAIELGALLRFVERVDEIRQVGEDRIEELRRIATDTSARDARMLAPLVGRLTELMTETRTP